MKEDKLLFVQFLHPGGEKIPRGKRPIHVGWNKGKEHQRKFIRARGKYCKDDLWAEADLLFWGEWEPQSEYTPIEGYAGSKTMPSGIHVPLLNTGETTEDLPWINTDPCVFGEHFMYCCCQQTRNGHPAQLSRLRPGSIILFGSCIGKEKFVVDTVFVVRDSIKYTPVVDTPELQGLELENYLKIARIGLNRTSGNGATSCGNVPCQSEAMDRLSLYYGATPEQPLNGMYSFVPCKPYAENDSGFERPVLTRSDMKSILEESITDNMTQGHKFTQLADVEQAREVWSKVYRLFHTRDNLFAGVALQMPEDKEMFNLKK